MIDGVKGLASDCKTELHVMRANSTSRREQPDEVLSQELPL
jgi:hypothetical protein